MPDGRERSSGDVLARELRSRFARAGIAANTIGALTVFAIAYLAPAPFDPDDEERVLLLNLATLAGVLAVSTPLLIGLSSRLVARPLERWLHEERPASESERELALRLPMRLTAITAGLWGLGAVVFAAANATVAPEMAVNAAIVVVLGGATTCAVCYLVAERLGRPLVTRALGGRPPSRTVAPGVAARLTMTWVLVSGVPLVGIAAMAIADLSGVRLDEPTPALATLLLALVGLLVGLVANTMAARSVADPVRAVRDAMGRVESGELATRVAVDDASEVGLLEAGFNSMAAGLAERERLRDLFGRHVGRDVARAALEGELRLGGEEREVAILFVDIVGSTGLAARRPPTEVVALLNAFFRLVVDTVERHGGWANKFEGDAALCVFGAPTAAENPAGAALAAGRELRDRLAAELPELDAGIGVSAGAAVAGNIGAERRFEYTVVGEPVNEAARLSELAKRRPERLLASEAALARADGVEPANWSLGEPVTLRGYAEPTRLASPVAR
jgi:adenylate cyclase